ncbi:hypothetical protein T10_11599 [Trichinella papuae]|uniref:Uncharacterized protein n=1 Tax=Trichinella papuae TaxID=268474 RepID=A0A0V1MTW3_9BILA|nr:hypothetical protein T10_11599 [Trichinella papuae]
MQTKAETDVHRLSDAIIQDNGEQMVPGEMQARRDKAHAGCFICSFVQCYTTEMMDDFVSSSVHLSFWLAKYPKKNKFVLVKMATALLGLRFTNLVGGFAAVQIAEL